LKKTTVAKFTE